MLLHNFQLVNLPLTTLKYNEFIYIYIYHIPYSSVNINSQLLWQKETVLLGRGMAPLKLSTGTC